VQPQGPYYLLGYSLGGLIALEMAQQLQQQGEVVQFIGLLDTVLNQDFAVLSRWERLVRHGRHLRRHGPQYLLKRLIRRFVPQPIESPTDDPTAANLPDFVPEGWVETPLLDCFQQAIADYSVAYYTGPLCYFGAWDDRENFREWYKYDAHQHWSQRVKKLHFNYTAGNHGTMLQDANAAQLAMQLERMVAQARVTQVSNCTEFLVNLHSSGNN
jgi:thioesterase domain-containing protein